MKDFILCTFEQTDVPYYAGIRREPVYSLEELCFYMQGHLFLIDGPFFGEDLFSWLGQELGLGTLSGALREMKENGSDVPEMIRKVFSFSGLYDREEMQDLVNAVHSLRDRPAVDRQLIYGDYLLAQKAYREALMIYLDLQKEGNLLQLAEAQRKRVFYHTGVIYARFLLLPEAADQFLTVYRKYEDRRGLEAFLFLRALAEREGIPFETEEADLMIDAEDLQASEDLYDRRIRKLSGRNTMLSVEKTLEQGLGKDDWISMLLKKYQI